MILNDLVSQIFFTVGKKGKSLAGLIDCAVSSLSFYFLCSIRWKYKCLEGSPGLLCHLLLDVRRSVCCRQPLRLTSSIPLSIQTGDIFWEGAHCFSFSLKLALAVAWQRRGSSMLRPLAVADVASLASCSALPVSVSRLLACLGCLCFG